MKGSLRYLKEVFFLLGESRRKLPWMVILFFLSALLDIAGLGLIVPYVSLVIDPATVDSRLFSFIAQVTGLSLSANDLLMLFGLLLLGLYFAKAVAAYFINREILRFSWEQQVKLRTMLMKAYQHLPYKMYLRRNSSEYVHAISGLTGEFSLGVVMNMLKVASDGIVGLSILIVLASVNGFALALFLALIGGTVLGYDRLFKKRLKSYGKEVTMSSEGVTKAIQEGIRGFKEIRILGAERFFLGMVENNSRNLAEASTSRDLIIALPRYLLDFMLFLFVVSIVAISIMIGFERQDLIPTLSLFGVGSLRLVPVANTISGSLVRLRYHRYATSRLYSDVQTMKAESTEIQKRICLSGEGYVQFDGSKEYYVLL